MIDNNTPTDNMLADAFFGLVINFTALRLGIITIPQVESTLILSAMGGVCSVIFGAITRYAFRKIQTLWKSRAEKRKTKRELLIQIKELEEKLK